MEKESTNANSLNRLWMFPCFWKNVEIFLFLFSIFQSFLFSVNRLFKNTSQGLFSKGQKVALVRFVLLSVL